MQRSLTGLYATAVCFAAVICATIAAGVVLYSTVRALAPEITAAGYPAPMYAPAVAAAAPIRIAPPGAMGMQLPSPSPKELERLRREAVAENLRYERRSGVRGLILWGIVLVVSGALWGLHWRLMKSEQGGSV